MGMDDYSNGLSELGLCNGVDKHVCGDCIGDFALGEFISSNATGSVCEYCNRSEDQPIATALDQVAIRMAQSINPEWTDPQNELSYTLQDAYPNSILEGEDLLHTVGFSPVNQQLFNDIASWFAEGRWCRKDVFGVTMTEWWRNGWDRFRNETMNRRRYTFWSETRDDDEVRNERSVNPRIMLAEIESIISKQNLIVDVSIGMKYWRARLHERTDLLKVPSGYTSPPRNAAKPNRMSPAGISMFYGAEHAITAAREVSQSIGEFVEPIATVVQFELVHPLKILDLVTKRRVISYFEENGPSLCHGDQFLRFFSENVSKPIKPDETQPVEYVPTQIFTEYVRHIMRSDCDNPVDGIRYQSSRDGQPCVVLFFDQQDCSKNLKDVDGSKKTFRVISQCVEE